MRGLIGRTALLTGATSGLGPPIARRLHVEGVRLTLTGRQQDALANLTRELVGSQAIPADLSKRGDVRRLATQAGPVDILVANAGLPGHGVFEETSLDDLDTVLEVNLRAPMRLARLLLPAMLERGGGHIVLMASMAGQAPSAYQAVYGTTKAGLRAFGHSLRAELKGTGVGVSVVSPYFVRDAGFWAAAGHHAPLEVTPEQVASAVAAAIRDDRAEVTVAPWPARLTHRIPTAFPELLQLGLARRIASGAAGTGRGRLS
ncbi:MAG TPA: SDR family NAD(P)-dependent oxidoreductase [Candidatus Binatia bacterium]|jgi:short-subunit dehydrogenase|nr:SDR family NAD(P)-dependent oxidoreductase [Candidatus Binatia bacterium]